MASPSAWPGSRRLNGGVDRLTLPEGPGAFWLCGKRLIGPDPDGTLERLSVDTVVCLNEEHELDGHYPGYVAWLKSATTARVIWAPIHDFGAPTLEEFIPLVADVRARLDRGATVLAHCGAGIGRTGTLAAGVLTSYGLRVETALVQIRAERPMAGPETGPQLDLVRAFAARRATMSSVGSAPERDIR